MKYTNTAFTLIELLVVIVIIGILATISTATFSGYNTKARDASRFSFVRQFSDILIAEGIAKKEGQPDKFNFSTTEMTALLNENNLEIESSNNICPQVIITLGPEDDPLNGDSNDNHLCVLSWGESSSTDSGSSAGLIYSGTSLCKDVYQGDTSFGADDFQCEAPVITYRNNFEFFPKAYAQFEIFLPPQGYYQYNYPRGSASLREYYVNNGQTNVGFAIHGGGYNYPVFVYKIKEDLSTEVVNVAIDFVCTSNCGS